MLFLENVESIKLNYTKYDKIYFPINHVKLGAISDVFKNKSYHIPTLAPDNILYGKVCQWKSTYKWGYDVFDKLYAPEYILGLQDTKAYRLMKNIAEESYLKNICLVCYCDNQTLCHLCILANILKNVFNADFNDTEYGKPLYTELYNQYQSAFYLLVAGSRTFNEKEMAFQILDIALKNHIGNCILVSGHAKGADTIAEQYAAEKNIPIKIFPADWDLYGKRAGYIRNMQMHDYISYPYDRKRACICFWDGNSKGTEQNFKLAKDHHTNIKIVNYLTKNIMTL